MWRAPAARSSADQDHGVGPRPPYATRASPHAPHSAACDGVALDTSIAPQERKVTSGLTGPLTRVYSSNGSPDRVCYRCLQGCFWLIAVPEGDGQPWLVDSVVFATWVTSLHDSARTLVRFAHDFPRPEDVA
jgi:hypothetical protein